VLVTPQSFILVLTLAAVVMAVWADLRFEHRRPESLGRRIAHTVAAFIVLELVTAGVASVMRVGAPVGEQTLVLFLAYLPSMIYAFLAGAWLVRTLVEIAGIVRR
jgi:hypothetical protein